MPEATPTHMRLGSFPIVVPDFFRKAINNVVQTAPTPTASIFPNKPKGSTPAAAINSFFTIDLYL